MPSLRFKANASVAVVTAVAAVATDLGDLELERAFKAIPRVVDFGRADGHVASTLLYRFAETAAAAAEKPEAARRNTWHQKMAISGTSRWMNEARTTPAPEIAFERLELIAEETLQVRGGVLHVPCELESRNFNSRGLTNSIIVTVLLGLFCGVGCTRIPLPPKSISNSAGSRTSSNLMLFTEPWNLTDSDLHSFLSLAGIGKPFIVKIGYRTCQRSS